MKRTMLVVLVAAVVLVLAGLFLAGRDPAARFTDSREAWEAYEEGDWLLQSFRYAEAREKLERALDLDPDFAMAQVAMAELEARMGRRQDAEQRFALADSLAAREPDPRARLLLQVRLSTAPLSRFSGDRDSLLAAAKSTVGEHLIVLASEAVQASAAGDLERTERVWKRVLEINPNYAAAYNFLGYLYLSQGRYEEAEAAMRRYAFVAPDLANPHDSLGEVLMALGRYEEAEMEFRTALDKQPDFFHSLINIGSIYVMRGQVDRANTLLDRVHDEVQGTEWVHDVELRRIRALFEHRIADDLDVYARRYVATHPKSSYATRVRIWRHIGLGEGELALALFDSLSTAYRERDWYTEKPERREQLAVEEARYRALVAEIAADHRAAAEGFGRALEQTSDLPLHATLFDRVHLAWNLVPLGNLEAARRQIGEVLDLNPRLPEAVLVAAAIEAAAGDAAKAHRLLDTLEQMLDRADPDFPPLVDAQRLRAQLPPPGRI